MAETAKSPKRPLRKPHTELRRQGGEKPEREDNAQDPKPRTPLDRLPPDGDEDDLFNDMPV